MWENVQYQESLRKPYSKAQTITKAIRAKCNLVIPEPDLAININIHASIFLFTNTEIFVGFTNPEELLQFVVRSDQEGKFLCSICQSFFHAKKYHVRNHVESKHFPNTFEYPCNICQKSYFTRKALESHLSKCKQLSMVH